MPAVGFAVGFDRTVEVADELGLLETGSAGTQVLIALLDETSAPASLALATELRQAGISVEVYPAFDKLTKQFKLADQKKIGYVAVIGSEELASGNIQLKNMTTGEQESCTQSELIAKMQK